MSATAQFTEVRSTFQRRPAYRYLRASDKLPTYAELADTPLSGITAKVRLFNPTGAGTWYVCAYDPEDGTAWGLAELGHSDIGTFDMPELVNFRGRFGLPIERDLHYTPVTLDTLV
jgi:hypothetical protein